MQSHYFDPTKVHKACNHFISTKAESTRKTYRDDLDHFCKFLRLKSREYKDIKSMRDLGDFLFAGGMQQTISLVSDYESYMLERRRKKLNPVTANKRISAIVSFVKSAKVVGAIDWDIAVKKINAPSEVNPGRACKTEVVLEMIAVAKDCGSYLRKFRDPAVLAVLYTTGLRRKELAGIKVQDIDFEAGEIMVLRKGKKVKTAMAVPPQVMNLIEAWLFFRGSHRGPLFNPFDKKHRTTNKPITGQGIYNIVTTYAAMLEEKCHPHSIRHRAILDVMRSVIEEKGLYGLIDVTAFSGHASVKSLEPYLAHLTDAQRKMSNMLGDRLDSVLLTAGGKRRAVHHKPRHKRITKEKARANLSF